MKITVYAISFNEEKFVRRWVDSMKEADDIVVLDTGSTDGTVALLRECGAFVDTTTYANWKTPDEYSRALLDHMANPTRFPKPWRFDWARNDSMRLIPPDTDICVCTDLDEVLCPGWRAKLEAAWADAVAKGRKPTTGTYEYVWNFNADGTDGSKFTYKKVHAHGLCRWTHPVHEVLDYGGAERVEVAIPGMRLEHHSDPGKSRESYLRLLELSVRECPDDDRNAHYLGREYVFNGRYGEALAALKRHLSMPRAVWRPERAASMRLIAKCLCETGKPTEAVDWYYKAMAEAPEQREAAMELAQMAHDRASGGDKADAALWWSVCLNAAQRALSVRQRCYTYLTKDWCWGYKPWDLLSLAKWNTGDRSGSLEAARNALKVAPNDARLQKNVAVIEEILGIAPTEKRQL